jgi:hypothetical protein
MRSTSTSPVLRDAAAKPRRREAVIGFPAPNAFYRRFGNWAEVTQAVEEARSSRTP